ncbi:homeodomain-only protein-like [Mya arenaria]|uniref:homeodomain-only protein-like n=1 Tax=Mya arenaria TaxID=6604 RepID=UPI0022E8BDE1|nr:homeodomain-only protein-like [Mya arenaria]
MSHPVRVPAPGDSSMMFTGTIRAQLTPGSRLPRLTVDQMTALEENFKQNRNPNHFELSLISAEVGLSEPDVKVWYQHRLAVWRQRQGLPANSGYVNE